MPKALAPPTWRPFARPPREPDTATRRPDINYLIWIILIAALCLSAHA